MRNNPSSHMAAMMFLIFMCASCDFGEGVWTPWGELRNQNDPHSVHYADYDLEVMAGIGAGAIPDDGPATALYLSTIGGLCVADGYLYIADTSNNRIVRVNEATGIAATIAGTGAPGFEGDGGPAVSAELMAPLSVTAGSDGSLYILDGALVIRKIDPSGVISTLFDIWEYEGLYLWYHPEIGTSRTGKVAAFEGGLYAWCSEIADVVRLTFTTSGISAERVPGPDYFHTNRITVHDLAAGSDGSAWLVYNDYSSTNTSTRLGYIAPGKKTITAIGSVSPKGVRGLAITPDGRVAFENSSSQISAYRLETNSVETIADLGNDSTFNGTMCINASGQIYRGSSRIVFKGNTDTIFAGEYDVNRINPVNASPSDYIIPYNVVLNADATSVYFTEPSRKAVKRVDVGVGVYLIEENADTPYGLGLASDGSLYYSTGDVRRIQSGVGSDYFVDAESRGLRELAISPNGEVIIGGWDSNIAGSYTFGVYKVDGASATRVVGNGSSFSNDQFVDGMDAGGLSLAGVNGLAFDDAGTLYVSHSDQILAISGGSATEIAGSFLDNDSINTPSSIVYHGGYLFVASGLSGIYKVSLAGEVESMRFNADGRTIDIFSNHGLAVDSAGCLYIPAGYQIIKATPRH